MKSGGYKRGPRRAKLGPEPLSAVLLRSPNESSKQSCSITPRAWHEAVGERIARRTRPMRVEAKVLTIRAATSVWAQELSFLAPAIVARLVLLGFDVEGLRFRVGPIEPPERIARPGRVKSVPAARPLPGELRQELERVADSGLRDIIARAAASNLAWQEARKPVTSKRRDAPAPRSAARENAPPDRTPTTGPARAPRKP